MLQTGTKHDSSIPIHSWVPESLTPNLHDKQGPAQEGQHHLRRLNMLLHTFLLFVFDIPKIAKDRGN
jgi:hypothetical protein